MRLQRNEESDEWTNKRTSGRTNEQADNRTNEKAYTIYKGKCIMHHHVGRQRYTRESYKEAFVKTNIDWKERTWFVKCPKKGINCCTRHNIREAKLFGVLLSIIFQRLDLDGLRVDHAKSTEMKLLRNKPRLTHGRKIQRDECCKYMVNQ